MMASTRFAWRRLAFPLALLLVALMVALLDIGNLLTTGIPLPTIYFLMLSILVILLIEINRKVLVADQPEGDGDNLRIEYFKWPRRKRSFVLPRREIGGFLMRKESIFQGGKLIVEDVQKRREEFYILDDKQYRILKKQYADLLS